MGSPEIGKPRQPRRLRVMDPQSEAHLKERFGDRFEVVVGGLPDLDDFLESVNESLANETATYLTEGVRPEVVEQWLQGAKELIGRRLWKRACEAV